jgi:propionyl-CoA carboxylase beta chain
MSEQTQQELLRLIAAAREQSADAARPAATGRVHAKGKLTARERIAALVDAGSFREIGQLARLPKHAIVGMPGIDPQAATAYGDGVVGGAARIDGRPVMVFAQDFGTIGGSSGEIGARIKERVADLAADRGVPLLMMLDGGGHRIQDGLDSRRFADTGPFLLTLVRLSGLVPIVALVLGDGFAGNTNYAALADLVVMVRGVSTMGIAGPSLVKAALGETITKDQLGGAERQVDRNGIAHFGVDDEQQAFDVTRRWLSYLPSNADTDLPVVDDHDPVDRREPVLAEILPTNPRRAYDVKGVLVPVVDEGSFLEIQPTYAANLVTAFARLGGAPVGVIANQPMVLAGTLDANACEKSARFISLCDAFGLPLVFFVDIPGFLVGSSAEDSKLGRRSARIVFELGRATVPRLSVVLRKGYGLGFVAMCGGRAFGAQLALAWPTAEICAMNIDGAVDVAFRKAYQAAPDPIAARQQIVDSFRARVGPLQAVSGFGLDDVIDPMDTRLRLIETLRVQPRRHRDGLQVRSRGISPI